MSQLQKQSDLESLQRVEGSVHVFTPHYLCPANKELLRLASQTRKYPPTYFHLGEGWMGPKSTDLL